MKEIISKSVKNRLKHSMYTTIVHPSEYDIDGDMIEAIKLSIREKSSYILMDIGKMVGLWEAYKELKEQYENEFGGQK
jgi:hypothetical protein